MIYDKTENAQRYMGISRNLDRALRYMTETDLAQMEDGRIHIDPDMCNHCEGALENARSAQ